MAASRLNPSVTVPLVDTQRAGGTVFGQNGIFQFQCEREDTESLARYLVNLFWINIARGGDGHIFQRLGKVEVNIHELKSSTHELLQGKITDRQLGRPEFQNTGC